MQLFKIYVWFLIESKTDFEFWENGFLQTAEIQKNKLSL